MNRAPLVLGSIGALAVAGVIGAAVMSALSGQSVQLADGGSVAVSQVLPQGVYLSPPGQMPSAAPVAQFLGQHAVAAVTPSLPGSPTIADVFDSQGTRRIIRPHPSGSGVTVDGVDGGWGVLVPLDGGAVSVQ